MTPPSPPGGRRGTDPAARGAELKVSLKLLPHPEGGHFAEIFRSPALVRPTDGRPERAAVTTIRFLLAAGEVSRWHRVLSDEIWLFSEGAPLELVAIDPSAWSCRRVLLGPEGSGRQGVGIVPGGWWQAARTTGAYTLVACTVAPGFEYEDYALFSDTSPEIREIRRRFPGLGAFPEGPGAGGPP